MLEKYKKKIIRESIFGKFSRDSYRHSPSKFFHPIYYHNLYYSLYGKYYKIVKFKWGSCAYGDSELIHCHNEYVISL